MLNKDPQTPSQRAMSALYPMYQEDEAQRLLIRTRKRTVLGPRGFLVRRYMMLADTGFGQSGRMAHSGQNGGG
jgi:hypothetical protein